MKIHDDHMYHGAALIQVAEHKSFTAINSLKIGKKLHRNSYKINDKIALYLKYASKTNKAHKEYSFTFSKQHLKDLKKIKMVQLKSNTLFWFEYQRVRAYEFMSIHRE